MRRERSSKIFSLDQLSFLRDKLPFYLKLGNVQKSRDREDFIRRTAEEFEHRFRDGDSAGLIFNDMNQYKYVSISFIDRVRLANSVKEAFALVL